MRRLCLVLLAGVLMIVNVNEVYAVKNVKSPKVHKGEWEIELKGGWDFDDRNSKDGKAKYKHAIGYGVTDRWAVEIEGEIEKGADSSDYVYKELEWENVIQLTEEDAFIDFGILLAYEVGIKQDKDDKVEGMFLFEKKLGKFKHTANVIFKKEVWRDATTETTGEFAWRTKHYMSKLLRPGFEYYIKFDELNEGKPYDSQEHQIGPVIYGKTGYVEYEIGYIFGISDAAPEGSLKFILEYEREF